MSAITEQYYESVQQKLRRVKEEESAHIDQAAEMIDDCVEAGRKVYFFGTGHSYMVGQEVFGRAGGYSGFVPILENELSMNHIIKSTYIERIAEYADVIMGLYPFASGDVCVVTSNSGRNQLVVETCLRLKALGVKIIAITSLDETKNVKSRHPSGKKLCDLADLVLNNMSNYGDVTLTHANGEHSGPTSTILDCFIIDAVVSNFIDRQISRHGTAPVFTSSNVDEGDARNAELFASYQKQ